MGFIFACSASHPRWFWMLLLTKSVCRLKPSSRAQLMPIPTAGTATEPARPTPGKAAPAPPKMPVPNWNMLRVLRTLRA